MRRVQNLMLVFFIMTIGTVGLAGEVSFGPERVISSMTDGAVEAKAADLDGDGDLDVLSVSDLDDKVAWYENEGLGSFGPETIISGTTDSPYALATADLDADADTDVIIGYYGANKISWYENTGTGFLGHDLPGTLNRVVDADVGDVDHDGDLDVLAVEFYPGKIVWYRNEGGSFSQVVVVTGLNYPYSSRLADLDGDDDLDVVAAIHWDHRIVWFENTNSGSFNPSPHPICSLFRPRPVDVADVDGDGDIDVIAASPGADQVFWYENLGAGVFSGSGELISNTVDGPYAVSVVDVDADGDLDVLSTGTSDHTVNWHENLGGGGFDLVRHVIADNVAGAYGVHAANLNGDGDIDVLATAYNGDKVCWYENLGSPPPEAIQHLVALIESFGLALPVERSLVAPLHQAVTILEDGNPDNDLAVCGKLGAFLNTVHAKEEAGKLTEEQAATLALRAEDIRNDLDCS